jgi:hypothetical protein
MATTQKDGASTKDPVAKLTDLGEGAIKRISDAPGADRLLGALNTTRDRLDELQRRIRGIDELERRVAVLERKVDKLSKATSSSASRRSAKSSAKTAAKT